jgi:hypothetical protein
LTKQRKAYRAFYLFYKEALKHYIKITNFYNNSDDYFKDALGMSPFSQLSLDSLESDPSASRFNGLKLVERLDMLKDYSVFKNYPAVSYSSAKASELPDSKTDICLYGYIPCMPEVAISTGLVSGCTNPTFINPIFLIFFDAL